MRYAALSLAALLSLPLAGTAQTGTPVIVSVTSTPAVSATVNTSASQATSMIAKAEAAWRATGLYANADVPAGNSSAEAVGVSTWVTSGVSGASIGLDAMVRSDRRAEAVIGWANSPLVAIGVTGGVSSGLTRYGIYGVGSFPGYAAYFNGNVAYTGNLFRLSSARLKQDVRPLQGTGVLERVRRLRPVSFAYQALGRAGGEPPGRHYGVIAEEVRAVFPEVVSDVRHTDIGEPPDPNDPDAVRPDPVTTTYAAVDYDELVALLMQAIQDQQEQIEALTARVERLERRP